MSRFHIHLYNRDDLLLLIFPYYDTRMFVRVLQLLDVKSKSSPWHWLRPLQKPGVPLSKTALLNHCAADPSFLKFVCDGALAAVKEHSGDAHCLTTVLGFFCTTIVGALEHNAATTELQLVHILKPLLKGLPSPVLDFAAASFMITAQLADKAQLSENVLHQIIENLTKNPQPSLDLEKVLLLVLLYQSQSSTLTSFPHKALLRLASVPTFPTTLGELSASGGHVTPLLVPLLAETLRSVQSQIDDTDLRKLAINLVSQVGLEDDSVEEIIRMAVENFDSNGLLGEQSDPVEQVANNSKEIIEWYTMFMKSLERKYPTQYDKEKEKQSIKHTLSARLRDDKMSVVSKLLELPLPELVSLLGLDVVLEQLLWLASKCCKSSNVSTKVQVQVLKCLCSSDLSQPGLVEDRILLAVLPYLFPLDNLDLLCTLEVLQSKFAQQNHMLMLVKKDLGDVQRVKNPAQVSSAVWRCLTPACLPNKHLWEAIDQAPHFEGDFSPHLLAITLLSKVVPENDPHASLLVLNKAIKCVEDSHMYVEQNVPNVTEETFPVLLGAARMGRLAVPGFINCLTRLMHKTPLSEHLKKAIWWNLAKNVVTSDDAAMLFVTRLFEVLITGCSLENLDMKRLYVDALKEFNDVYFPSLKEQVQFLYKLSVGSEMTPTSLVVNPELRLRALRLTAALLQKTSEPLGWCLDRSDCALIPSLLIILAYPLAPFRMTALDCLNSVGRLFGSALNSDNWGPLVTVLLSRREELIMDHKHIYLVMYQYLSTDIQESEIEQLKPNMESCLKTLLKLIGDVETPPYISAALLKILKRVNSESVLLNLVPLGLRVLSISQQMDRELDIHHSVILRNVLGKLEHTTSDCLKHDKCWELVESTLKDSHTVVWADNGTPTCPAIVTLTQLSQVPLEHLPNKLQQKLVTLLIEISTDTDLADVLSACRHFMKKIILDASIVVEELTKMRDVQGNEITPTGRSKRLRRSVNLAPSLSLLQSPIWKRGVTMLEFVQNKKKLNSVHLMLPVLFDILKKSLEFETQAPVEYTKQLVLSSILNCCQKLSPDGELIYSDLFVPERTLNVELIVHCIRATQNPQTHHHALLVLAHLAGMIPEQVLHNMMSIFTFMGYSVLRHDDAFSFQVISKIMETIIPVLIKASQSDKISLVGDQELTCSIARVLNVFTVALLDIPEHRRLPLFYKLLSTLDPNRSLWLLLCLVVESHVSCWSEGDLPKGHSKDETPKRLEFCLSLAAMFPIAALSDVDTHLMEPLYISMIELMLKFISRVSREVGRNANQPSAKYWKIMLNQSCDILDKVNCLLPGEMVIPVVRRLLDNKLSTVRRKTMELLNNHLQHQADSSSKCDPESYFNLLPPLMAVVGTIGAESKSQEGELELNQQTALLSLKLMARFLGLEHPTRFQESSRGNCPDRRGTPAPHALFDTMYTYSGATAREKISTSFSPRVLVPAVSTCFSQLLRNNQHAAIGPLLHILSDSFTAMSPEERVHHQPYLITFFLEALQFRSDSSEGLEAVALVEGHIVDALVALVLKLSESSFRPLYFKLFHWATSSESHKDRTITFYRLSSSIAEHLKGLFVLFAGHFLKNAAGLLDANNLAKTDTLYFGSGKLAKTKADLLLQQILKTLHGVFMYDRQKFINKERFDVLMQPIVDQLENTLGGVEGLQSRASSFVKPCIAEFAVAIADDALWKDLNYQILLKTSHNMPEVRLAALQTLCEVAHKLGEDFLPFLPETVPFLAERLEDEEEKVEKEAKRVVQELEEVLGESLQKYF
uniref:HEAT repeat-containing protein 1 n=1 Tax=Timema shepardi TaxID=629360 RepID=A0A7R9FVL3_TIMSH|nr:unnamed protein product [Timema shepardi]